MYNYHKIGYILCDHIMKIYIYILKLHIKYDIIYSDNYILVYSISYIC